MINEKECKENHVQTENVVKIKKDVNEQLFIETDFFNSLNIINK